MTNPASVTLFSGAFTLCAVDCYVDTEKHELAKVYVKMYANFFSLKGVEGLCNL